MKKKKICIFCETWESGGIESFLHNVLMRMDLSDIEIDIVASCLKDSIFTAPLKDRGVCFYELSGNQQNLSGNYRRFEELLKRRHYDVIHVNAFQALTLRYLYLAHKAGVQVRIAHSHNTDLRKSATRQLKMAIHRWASKRYRDEATQRWACSSVAAEFLFGENTDFQFIPNGIDTERFRFDLAIRESVRAELGLGDAFVIGNVGRLCYQKNPSFLLDVFAEVLKHRPNSRLLLIGEGDDRVLLEEKAGSLGIADKIILYGVSTRVEHFLWAMDALVMPSRFEGLPVTAIEAQTAGLPCLLSDAITTECRTGESTAFLPLSTGAAAWAKYLLAPLLSNNRSVGADEARRAGFDIANTADFMERMYKENCE